MPNSHSILFEIWFIMQKKVNFMHIHHPPYYFPYRIYLHPTLDNLNTKALCASLLFSPGAVYWSTGNSTSAKLNDLEEMQYAKGVLSLFSFLLTAFVSKQLKDDSYLGLGSPSLPRILKIARGTEFGQQGLVNLLWVCERWTNEPSCHQPARESKTMFLPNL